MPGPRLPACYNAFPNTTLRMPQVPQDFGYALENAFGNLVFFSPVALRTPPGETNRIFVVEQGGKIWAITNLSAPNKTLFMDISRRVLNPETGLTAWLFILAMPLTASSSSDTP